MLTCSFKADQGVLLAFYHRLSPSWDRKQSSDESPKFAQKPSLLLCCFFYCFGTWYTYFFSNTMFRGDVLEPDDIDRADRCSWAISRRPSDQRSCSESQSLGSVASNILCRPLSLWAEHKHMLELRYIPMNCHTKSSVQSTAHRMVHSSKKFMN